MDVDDLVSTYGYFIQSNLCCLNCISKNDEQFVSEDNAFIGLDLIVDFSDYCSRCERPLYTTR